MFGNSKKIKALEAEVLENNRRLIELKVLLLANNNALLQVTAEMKQMRLFDLVKKVKKPRKAVLRSAKGFTKISEEERQEFKRLFDQGLSILDIAATTGRSSASVGKHLHEMLDGIEEPAQGAE